MKILIPTADYPPIEGGIATVTRELSRELADMGHEVLVVAPFLPGHEAFEPGEGIRVLRYRGYRLGWFRFFPMLAVALPHLRGSGLVLAINIAYGGVIGMLGRALFNVPYVTFAYAYEFLKFGRATPIAALLRAVYLRSCMTVAISTFTRDQLIAFGVEASRIRIILPGASRLHPVDHTKIEETRRSFNLDGRRTILAVGRMIPRKGHLTLIEAMPKILKSQPNTVLVCAGRGPTMAEVEQRVSELNLEDAVRMPGLLSDSEIAALYDACDLFALPTGEDAQGQVEGFGLVFTEANAHGKPVVAGRSGGVVDAVIDGETGLIVSPDDPEALAAAIARLLDDPALARKMGDAGRARVEQELNWDAFATKLMDLVEAKP